MAKKRQSDAATIVKRRKDAAALLGITPRVLGLWANETWFPEEGRTAGGGWDVAAIRAARDAMGRKGSERSDRAKEIKLAKDAESLRREILKRRTEELLLAERAVELVPRRAVELFCSTFLTAFGDWADQLPEIVVADLPKKQRPKLRKRLKEELDRKRRELRGELERHARELDEQRRQQEAERGQGG